MNKIATKKYFKLSFFLFFLVASIIYFWPFLKHPAFNLIDDGVSLKISKEIVSGDIGNLIEIKNGRIRPFYWLYFAFIYTFSGINPFGFWISQTILFSFTLFLVWNLLTNETEKNKWSAYLIAFSLLVLFFIPAISSNLFRLGTAEPKQMLLIVSFMIWMKKTIQKKTLSWVGVLIFLLAILTKETSILLMPMFFVFLLPHIIKSYKEHKDKFCLLLFFSFFSIIFYSLITAMRSGSSYSASFGVNFSQIKLNMLMSRLDMNEVYYFLFASLILGFIRFLFFSKERGLFTNKKENHIFKVILEFWKENSFIAATLTGLISSLFFVFSWEHQLARYYYPVYLFLFIYFALELKKFFHLFLKLKNNKYKFSVLIFPITILFILYSNFFQKIIINPTDYLSENNRIKRLWYSDYQNSYSIIKILLNGDYSKIYTTIDDYEVVYELGLLANKLDFNKNKIRLFSTNKEIGKTYEYISYSKDIEDDFLKNENENTILVAIESKDLDLDKTRYTKEILTNEFLVKYSDRPNWVIWRRK